MQVMEQHERFTGSNPKKINEAKYLNFALVGKNCLLL
jgi:hypothetical protein